MRLLRLPTLPLMAALLLTAAFTACGDDDDDPDDAATQPPAASATSASTSAPTRAATSAPTEVSASLTVDIAEVAGIGEVLVDSRGYTLYTFDNDTPNSGASSCSGGCLQAWPVLEADGEPTGPEALTGELGTITRDDGTMQVTYGGWPLYFYASDMAPGEANGDGVGGVWHVATPDSAETASTAGVDPY